MVSCNSHTYHCPCMISPISIWHPLPSLKCTMATIYNYYLKCTNFLLFLSTCTCIVILLIIVMLWSYYYSYLCLSHLCSILYLKLAILILFLPSVSICLNNYLLLLSYSMLSISHSRLAFTLNIHTNLIHSILLG